MSEELDRRVSRLEKKLDNGVFINKELYYDNRENRDKEIQEIKDTLKWLMRGIIVSFATILFHLILTIITTVVMSGIFP